MPKIVLFGATGYTGRLTAEALIARGAAPVLAARDATAVEKLAADLGGAQTAVADVTDPGSVRALLGRGDVLVTTVGPFLRYGGPALAAALAAGAHYFDSTGEGPFIRGVFDRDEQAREAGVGLLSAFGFDYVPGNLAAALALREAPEAVRADIGYFMASPGTSGGTRASMAGMLFEPGFALRGGRVVPERAGARIRTFRVAGRPRTGVSIPASEHLALNRSHPRLREADVFLGLPSAAARGLQAGSVLTGAVARVEPVKRLAEGLLERVVQGSTGGPTPRSRARTRSWAVAEAFDDTGRVLASVTLTGGDPYDFTAAILTWGAQTALDGGLLATGALGPVDAFGLDALTAGAADAGFSR
ncbi:saccharopine dehydrogenase NADP-binding domain-containing protein [Nocardia implantans]|uniref:Saccharopine dehydrogenase NADP-binding domain-containing protein n=1 Tax=Nocardia implantans TaxID=3108168 RepID=A0ABU6ARJ8_9NOCA|nr:MULTISPECIES: saccharopine dehydrogenase NADP-binding domain-containing protein [unclassified Nocardia]MBF6191548.1 saccharopine dehydrogenase NADP-binding domain-containing protein [Nocardia beijingensis]MEA3528145.1 saccharopine dehydrogenase NADP-binding domain-containing protein [Nocardia sp. CDC192]MEB3510105.1 saccharopine dehydrogenase NADP-binding domain-containing protein [Nocardia sp. CDC186]